VGGEALFQTNLEVRLRLFHLFDEWVSCVLFSDGADVTRSLGGLDLIRLHWASGAGLRYDTPIGPIRFDVGFRLNRRGAAEPDPGEWIAFHLSIGESF
jgi:outer membrane translocation and assembly module TamA